MFKQFIEALRARINDSLAGLPADAQLDAASAPAAAVKNVRRIAADFASIFDVIEAKGTEIEKMVESKKDEMMAAARAELLKDTKALAEAGFISKADHETALTVARDTASKEARADGEKVLKGFQQSAERRKELVTSKVLTSAAAEALPLALLAADDYKDQAGKIAARMARLSKIPALAEDAATIARIATIPATAEGEAEFSASADLWEKAAGGKSAAAPLNPGQPGQGNAPLSLF